MDELVQYRQGQENGRRGQGQTISEQIGEAAPRLEDLIFRALRQVGVEELEDGNVDVDLAAGAGHAGRGLDHVAHGLNDDRDGHRFDGAHQLDQDLLIIIADRKLK